MSFEQLASVSPWRAGSFYTLLAHSVYVVVKAVKSTDSLAFYLSCFFLSALLLQASFCVELGPSERRTNEREAVLMARHVIYVQLRPLYMRENSLNAE
jgi:hypothetical protein